MTPTKFTLSCVGSTIKPRINHAIYYGTRADAIAESSKIAKVLGPAGYYQFRLFEADEFIVALDVSTETTVTVIEAKARA